MVIFLVEYIAKNNKCSFLKEKRQMKLNLNISRTDIFSLNKSYACY